jgi:small subunit ribosomal protein S16
MKSFGRRHRPFFRICAMDARTPRDGKAIEELGHYDPMVKELDARAVLVVDRIRYWLSVGAQPSEKVASILKRHGVKKPLPGEPWALPKVEAAPTPTTPPAPATSAPAKA